MLGVRWPRAVPTRLRVRIAFVFVLHALAMAGLTVLALLRPAPHPAADFYRLPEPAKVALVTAAFEHTPPASHGDLLRAFTDNSYQVLLLPALPAPGPEVADGTRAPLYARALGGRPFRIQAEGMAPPADFDAGPLFSRHRLQVAVALPDGQALAIRRMTMPPLTRFLENRPALLVLVVLVDMVAVGWLARLTTGPLERLARAVREDRLDGLAPGGPAEIRELAAAFTRLRAHLRSLVSERTHTLAAIAHDYRTYLTRMQLRSEFIEDPRQRALALQDLDEMNSMLNDTLAFARETALGAGDSSAWAGGKDSGGDADTECCDVVTELAALPAERRQKGQVLHLHGVDGVAMAQVSALALRRMMTNLLDNALRYGGGEAMISLARVPGGLTISVDDNGPGVPPDSLERLLHPFERLETSRGRESGGVGLGLAIVQALARRRQGDLALANRREGGFRAVLTLKAAR